MLHLELSLFSRNNEQRAVDQPLMKSQYAAAMHGIGLIYFW